MSGRRRALLVAAAVLAVAGGCTEAGDRAGSPGGSGTQRASAAAPPVSPPSQEAPAVPDRGDAPTYTQPLVLVTHHTRRPVDLPLRTARGLLAGRVRDWSLLGEPAGRLRLVPAGTAPARAVRAVVRDRTAVAALPAAAVGPRVRAVRVDGVDPLRRPGRYPLRTAADAAPPRTVRLTVAGDVMLGRGVAAAADPRDPVSPLRPMAHRFGRADLVVGNLESTLSRTGAPTQGDDSFAADPAVAAGLADLGFDVLGLANNHAGDYGGRALVRTVRRLRTAGLATFGAGAGPPSAWRPAVLERGGVRFGFLGFNAIGETPAVAPGRPGAVSVSMPPRTGPLDRPQLRRFLRAVRDLRRSVDVVVVLPHWGTQYTNVPEPVQRTVARRLAAAGADLVVGGHPHWVQGAAMAGDTLVVHSLGNLVFDMDFMPQTMRGVLLEAVFWGPRLKAVDFVPYEMDERFVPRIESRRAGRDTLRLMWESSGAAFRP